MMLSLLWLFSWPIMLRFKSSHVKFRVNISRGNNSEVFFGKSGSSIQDSGPKGVCTLYCVYKSSSGFSWIMLQQKSTSLMCRRFAIRIQHKIMNVIIEVKIANLFINRVELVINTPNRSPKKEYSSSL